MILPAHPPVSVPALVTGNQIDDGFYKGFFRSLLVVARKPAVQSTAVYCHRPDQMTPARCQHAVAANDLEMQ
jgi:hypothetical protein